MSDPLRGRQPGRLDHPGRKLPYAPREGIDEAQAADVTAFLNLCGQATTAACAFSAGTPAATRAKWNALLRRLAAHPVTTGSPPQSFTYFDALEVVDVTDVSARRQDAVQLRQLWAASAATAARPPPAPRPRRPLRLSTGAWSRNWPCSARTTRTCGT